MEQFRTVVEIPVQWGDMDAAQHVNNVVYLKWVEAARVKLFTELNGGSLQNQSVGPILAWQECKYIAPVFYPDSVMVGCRVSKTEGDRMILETKIYSKKDMSLVAISRQMIVAYDYIQKKKLVIPDEWKVG